MNLPIRNAEEPEYVQMMQSGKYTIAYLAKMAKVSRQTLYNWKADLQ